MAEMNNLIRASKISVPKFKAAETNNEDSEQ